jgi:hypothetical protein
MLFMVPGEAEAWKILNESEPPTISGNADAVYDGARRMYLVSSLNSTITVSPESREIGSDDPEQALALERVSYFVRLAVLWYLVRAREIGLTGRLVRPQTLKDGHHFFTGSHELPLAGLAERFGSSREEFGARARALGGERVQFGDEAYVLRPLPRLPLTVILWVEDEEYPARADLLFDSSADYQVPIDISWSAAMYTLLMLMA